MKQLRYFALALLLGAIISVQAFADGKPNLGGGGFPQLGSPAHFGLSDSCWNVFLSGLSAGDAAKLTADETTISTDEGQIDTLQRTIDSLLRHNGGARDSATRARIKALDAQIRTLNDAIDTAQMEIGTIIKNNGSALQTIAENCGRPKRDTGKGGGDTTKGGNNGGGDHGGSTKGQFGLSDSCWNIFLAGISTSDAGLLAADQKTISANEVLIDTLMMQIRTLLKGGAKDSATRAAIKGLLAQIHSIEESSDSAQRNYALVIKANDSLLQSVRQNCGRTTHHGTAGGPGNGLSVSDIVPNPATANGTASITVTLTSDADVIIFISSATAFGPPAKLIFNGMLTAGSNVETLNLSGLGTGAYIVTIQSGFTTIVKKLVIQ